MAFGGVGLGPFHTDHFAFLDFSFLKNYVIELLH